MDSREFLGDSIAVSLAKGLAVASAVVLNLSIALQFGVGHQADAFFLAYAAPGALAGAMATAVRVALVPSIVRLFKEQPEDWRILPTLGLIGFLFWVTVAVVAILGRESYVNIVPPSITSAAERLTLQITKWVFVLIPLTWLVEFLRALLIAQQRFVLPLVGECVANLLAICLILIVSRNRGIVIVGVSFIAKMLVQATVSVLGLERNTRALWPPVALGHGKRIYSALSGLAVRLGGSLLRQGSTIMERFWSASLKVGTLSALSYAQMGSNMLSTVFSTSVATVLLPTLSYSAHKLHENHAGTSADAIRLVIFLTAPVAGLGIVFSYPICQAIFALNDTPAASVTLTSRLLAIYALRTSSLALIAVLLTPFYAHGDVWTPVKHMILMLAINLALDLLLFPYFAVYAFPVAAIITDGLSIGRGFWLQRKINIQHSARKLGRDSAVILVSLGTALVLATAIRDWGTRIAHEGIGQLVLVTVTAGFGVTVYLMATYVAGVPEAAMLASTIRKKLRL